MATTFVSLYYEEFSMKTSSTSSCLTTQQIGVGIDTARYGHRVNFLRGDRQPAAKPLTVTEDQKGYHQLRQRLELLIKQYPQAQIRVHIDAAGQYATNLERFLRSLAGPISISIGEPKRNKDYHKAIFPKSKTDNTESLAMARFAIAEQPAPTGDVGRILGQRSQILGSLRLHLGQDRVRATSGDRTEEVCPFGAGKRRHDRCRLLRREMLDQVRGLRVRTLSPHVGCFWRAQHGEHPGLVLLGEVREGTGNLTPGQLVQVRFQRRAVAAQGKPIELFPGVRKRSCHDSLP